MEKEKPLYVFEGSGAPEAKLKPRDQMENLLLQFKENGIVNNFSMPFDIGTAMSPELFWKSLETGLKVFGPFKVYSQIILDLRSNEENFEIIEKMIAMNVVPVPTTMGGLNQIELAVFKVRIASLISTKKLQGDQN